MQIRNVLMEDCCTLANTMQLQPCFSLTGSCVSVFNLNNQLCLQRPSVHGHRTTDVYQQWHQKRLLKHTRAFWIPPSELIVPTAAGDLDLGQRGSYTIHSYFSSHSGSLRLTAAHTRAHLHLHAHRNYPQPIFPNIHTHAAPLFSQTFFFFSLTWWEEKSSVVRWASSRHSIKDARIFGAQKQLGGNEVARASVYSPVPGANYLLAPLPAKK